MQTVRPKLAASVIAGIFLSAVAAFPATETPACRQHRRSGAERQRHSTDGCFRIALQSLGAPADQRFDQRAWDFRLWPAHTRCLFRASVPGQFRSSRETEDRGAAGHAEFAVCQSGERIEFHRAGVCQARRRRSDERRLEVGAEGVRIYPAGIADAAWQRAAPIRNPI
jgi:hypothetical protein